MLGLAQGAEEPTLMEPWFQPVTEFALRLEVYEVPFKSIFAIL
jgi:hypothetical protein